MLATTAIVRGVLMAKISAVSAMDVKLRVRKSMKNFDTSNWKPAGMKKVEN